jgi:hypothetical protein
MTKERRSQKEDKKKPAMTPKEKKAAKKSRKESRDFLGNDTMRPQAEPARAALHA